MMLLYNIGNTHLYILHYIASPFNNKASLWLKGRRDGRKKLRVGFGGLTGFSGYIVLHWENLNRDAPVIEMIKERDPSIKIFLTFFSPSGYEVRKDYEMADYIMYLPADTRRNARYLLDSISPEAVIFIKYEFWYNLLNELQKRSIPHYLVSGIFRKDQMFFGWYGMRFLKVLRGFTEMFVQDGDSEKLLRDHGIERVRVSGDTRFDRVFDIARKSAELDKLKLFCRNRDAIIAGSSWPAEEEMICRYINLCSDKIKWVIAPHEIDAEHILSIENKLEVKSIRYSAATGKNPDDYKVLIIDNIGILSSVYRYGRIAIIGGGFGRGIHNILEPASWGLPVLFGPNHSKFREANELLSSGGAFTFSDNRQFTEILDNLLNNDKALEEASKRATEYVKSNLGATVNVVDKIL